MRLTTPHRLLAAAALLLAAACTDRPLAPPAPRAASLEEGADVRLVVGATPRGIARLEVAVLGDDGRRWSIENPHPEEDEAWGAIALPRGAKAELEVRGYDGDGNERFAGTVAVATEGDGEEALVAQRRAPIEVKEEFAPTDPHELYVGSLRVGSAPRWADGSEPLTVRTWLHDADGARRPVDEKSLVARLADPEAGSIEARVDELRRELVIGWIPYPQPERRPPVTEIWVCKPGDVFCGRTFLAPLPLTVAPPPRTVVKLSANGGHSCAIDLKGRAACWGSSAPEVLGRTGSTNELARHQFTDIAAGADHGCAVDGAGDAWCWGRDDRGQLGTGAAGATATAVPVRVTGGNRYRAIAAGDHFTCAIDERDAVWCWGANGAGQLGIGTTAAQPDTADPVPLTLRTGGAVAIAAGRRHACVLTQAGQLECWGSAAAGALGGPGSQACGSGGFEPCEGTPVLVPDDGGFRNAELVAIGAGGHSTCAIRDGGALFCWGLLVQGQPKPTPPTAIDAGEAYRSVAVGITVGCAVRVAGGARCWGENDAGQLGAGFVGGFSPAPLDVAAPPAAWAQLAVGSAHACGIRVDRGAIYCWGDPRGAGFGGNVPQTTPRVVRVF